jgi:hypothetical protein
MTKKTTPEKPLSLGASRNLQKLIENDFSALGEHLNQYAADQLTKAEAAVKAKWATRGVDTNAFIDRAIELDRGHEDAKQALIREALAVGIQLEKSYGGRRGWTADASGLKEAISAAQKAIRADQTKAATELRIQHKAAERRVLLATVTGEAKDLLKSLPTAAQLMAKVAKTRALTA